MAQGASHALRSFLDEGKFSGGSAQFWSRNLTVSLDCAIPGLKVGFPQGLSSSLRQAWTRLKPSEEIGLRIR